MGLHRLFCSQQSSTQKSSQSRKVIEGLAEIKPRGTISVVIRGILISKRKGSSRTVRISGAAIHGCLYNQALRLTRNSEDASDIVQETYLRAYRTFANFKEGTNCKAWLFTILYSIFVNKYRKHQREADTVSIEELEQKFHRTLADGQWETNFVATGSDLDWQEPELNHALAKLPEEFRSAVLLVDVQGFT